MSVYKLKGVTKDYIWGGYKLSKYFHKGSNEEKIAETWDLSFLDAGLSLIDSGENKGKVLKDVVTIEELGTRAKKYDFFPLLIKYIDSADNLSVQVHPSDRYARKHEGCLGKTEMWYILEAEEDSFIYLGLNKDYTKREIRRALKEQTIFDCLNKYKAKPGDSFFIPSGTIHAIGKGVTLVEIQESSNLTYRLYDYGRLDKNGKPRELHIEKALAVVDLKKYEKTSFSGNLIGFCKYFEVFVHEIPKSKSMQISPRSFVCISFIEGEGKLNELEFKKGDSFFIGAGEKLHIKGKCKIVLSRLR